jgi:hypothetical protein
MLKQYKISDWPNMKKHARESEHKRLYRIAYPATMQERKSLTVEEISKILNG